MAEFEYRGIGPHDVAVEGRLHAINHDQANKVLEQMQIRACNLQITSATVKSATKPISREDFIMLNEQIIAMVKAGVPLEEGFRHLGYDLAKPGLKRLVNEVAEDLASGTSLDEAIRNDSRCFQHCMPR